MDEYLNPNPSSAKRDSVAMQMKKKFGAKLSKQGRMGAHLDDMGDIYDHTKNAFGGAESSDDNQAQDHEVEEGERRIRGNINLDEFD